MNWLWANKEWLFQGIGATVLLGALGLLVRRKKQASTGAPTPTFDEAAFLRPTAPRPEPPPFWKHVEHIPGFRRLARSRLYTEGEIGHRLRVVVQPEGDGIAFWKFGAHGRVEVRLEFVNHNPFPLILDRISAEITVNGSPVRQVATIDRQVIKAHSNETVYLKDELTQQQIEQIEFHLKQQEEVPAGFSMRAYFQSEVRDVTVFRQSSSGNCRFQNFPRRKRQHEFR